MMMYIIIVLYMLYLVIYIHLMTYIEQKSAETKTFGFENSEF